MAVSTGHRPAASPRPARRRFVRSCVAGGAALGLGWWPRPGRAETADRVPTLAGTRFDLTIGETRFAATGRSRPATTVNGLLPAPLLRWREGDTVTIAVTNRLAVPTSIHWHGILLPAGMDGVPGLSYPGIAPGETFTYRFPVRQSGTYWYHAHSRFQEQTGLYGPIVIEPANGERATAAREHVLLLSDWSDEDPETIFANLKKMSDLYDLNEPTALAFVRDAARVGVRQALAERRMWNAMRMRPSDLSDVTAATYTYLVNGRSPDGNWTGLFQPGEKVRLRIINGSSMTLFDIRIPGLRMTVVAADGQDVEPVTIDEFRIAVAEVYDVIVEPEDDRAYTVFAQAIDRLGYARATLAPRDGMRADVPSLDEPAWLSMTDMMGATTMAGVHDHGPAMPMNGAEADPMPGMAPMPPPTALAHHARTEYGPGVDMRVDMPRTNLDDPGVGLRDADRTRGGRVLTYADLHTIGGSLDPRGPGREIELHLTGNMQRYLWSFDGQKFSDARPLHFRRGERLRIVLVNDTMMPHPIHLHGMWSELESADQRFQVRKHTILVQPAQRITYLVTADAPGRWAYHCHLLYHMEAGMFREVVVS